ncbi:MAG: alpha/beta fold hydrolase, partial [Trichodesmium sp. MAG_R03]|nr:alpha/beta fold hydrolase [Trichodesmium sp. MAG_R03]
VAEPSKSDFLLKLEATPANERRLLLVAHVRRQVANVLGISHPESIAMDTGFFDLGMDSLTSVELRNKLQSSLKCSVPSTLAFNYPTLEVLVEYLADVIPIEFPSDLAQTANKLETVETKEGSDWIACHKPKPNASIRLFCFHNLGGSASMYRQWSDALPPEIEVLPIQLPGREQRLQEQPFTDFASLIEILADFLSPYLDKPFAFFGHSMGSYIAFELACVLEEQYNLKPIHLFLSGLPPLSENEPKTIPSISETEEINRLLEISEIPESLTENSLFFTEFKKIFKADFQLLKSYHYSEKKPLDYPIYSFCGVDDDLVSDRELSHWSKYTTSNLKINRMPGKHMFMFLKDSEKLLLKLITQELL